MTLIVRFVAAIVIEQSIFHSRYRFRCFVSSSTQYLCDQCRFTFAANVRNAFAQICSSNPKVDSDRMRMNMIPSDNSTWRDVSRNDKRDVYYHDAVATAKLIRSACPAER